MQWIRYRSSRRSIEERIAALSETFQDGLAITSIVGSVRLPLNCKAGQVKERSTVQKLKDGIAKPANCHTLRHSFTIHLLDARYDFHTFSNFWENVYSWLVAIITRE